MMAKDKRYGGTSARQVTDENAKVYHFVPFASQVVSHPIRGHQRLAACCGRFDCSITAITPVHVADGLIVPTDDLRGHGDITNLDQDSESLVLSHYRIWCQERASRVRAIPATSLKGAVRTVVEAVTDSCICCISRESRSIRETLPVRRDEKTAFERLSRNCRVDREDLKHGERKKLCPACRIFGALGFEGHVRFSDALQRSGDGRIARRPVPNSPNRRGTFLDKYHENVASAGETGVWRLRGRKVYHHFEPLRDLSSDLPYEPIEVCNEGSTFAFRVAFENLTLEDLGVLLVGLGQHEDLTRHSLGASKPFGYGAVSVQITDAEVCDMNHELARQRCLEFDVGASVANWKQTITDAIACSVKPGSGFVDLKRVKALAAIWNPDATVAEHGNDTIELWQKGQERLKPHP